jgi:hypothetical protein
LRLGPLVRRRQVIKTAAGLSASLVAAPVVSAVTGGTAAAAPTGRHGPLEVPIQLYIEGISVDATSTALIQQYLDKTINAKMKGVRAMFQPQGNASGIVSAMLAGSPVPWVVSSCCTDWPVFLPFLENLDPYITRDNINERAIWGAGQLSRFREPTGLYGLPEDAASDVYLYRQDILNDLGLPYPEPNWTWSEAEALWRKCTGNVHGQWRYGTNCPFAPTTMEGLPTVVAGYGGAYMDATHTRCLLNESGSIKAGEYWFHMVWDKVATWGDGVPNPAIVTGQLVFNTSADPTVLFAVTQLGNKVEWDFCPWPSFPVRSVGKLHDNFYAMLSSVPNKEIAWTLLKWIAIEKDWYRFYMRVALTPPARADMMEEWYTVLRNTAPILRNKHLEYWGDPTLAGEGIYDFEFFQYNPTQAQNLLMNTWPKIWNQQVDVTEGFDTVAQQINALEASGAATAATAAKVEAIESKGLNTPPSPTSQYPAPAVTGVGVPAQTAATLVHVSSGVYTLVGDGSVFSDKSTNAVVATAPQTATEGEWVLRVLSLSDLTCSEDGLGFVDGWSKVGLMASSDLSDDAAFVSIHVTGGSQIEWQFRSFPGITSVATGAQVSIPANAKPGPHAVIAAAPAQTAPQTNVLPRPVWLKLRRVGTQWWGYSSADGKTWTPVAPPVTVKMAGTWMSAFTYARNATFGGQGYLRAAVDQLSFSPSRFMQIGQNGVPPKAGTVPAGWATMKPLPAAVATLPPGVTFTKPLPVTPGMAAEFKKSPITAYAWTVLSAAYASRPDLQGAFPSNKAGYQGALLGWGASWGTGVSGGIDGYAPYLWPFAAAFAKLAKAAS